MMGSAASTGPVSIAGTLNATATATWGKTFDDLTAHTDATINAGVGSHQPSKLVAAQASSSPATSGAPATATSVPVEGVLHATYTGKTQQLALDRSYFRTPQTSLNLNGTVSKNSSLAVQLQANDLREVESIADLFRSPAPGQPMQPLGLSGTATFNGIVRGSTSAPHLTGQLNAQNLQLEGSSWKLIRTTIDASPSNLSLQHAELDPAKQGRLTLNASAQLRKWSFSKSSPIELQLNASQLDIQRTRQTCRPASPCDWHSRRQHQNARQSFSARKALAL